MGSLDKIGESLVLSPTLKYGSGGRKMKTLSSMIRDKAGNFGILTALGALPVIAACGAGLDFATAHSKRTELQSVADAAVLFAASSGERDETKLKQIARNVFASMANNQFGATPVIESVDLDNDDHITMK